MKRITLLLSVGLLILAASIYAAYHRQPLVYSKTLTVTTSTSANATTNQDTIKVPSQDLSHARSIVLFAKIAASTEARHGYGLSDSATFIVKTICGDSLKTLDSVKVAAIPTTRKFTYTEAILDTGWCGTLWVIFRAADTTSDTAGIAAAHTISTWGHANSE